MSSNNNSKNGLIAAVVILALALIGALIWGFSNKNNVQTLQGENAEISGSLDEMTLLRDDLAREVDSLAGEYDLLANQNSQLSGQLSEVQDALAKAQAAVDRTKRNSAAEANDLRAQIAELREARSALLASMEALQAQNDSLRMRTGQLETGLAEQQSRNEELTNVNTTMQGEIKKLTYENFKASAFEVVPEVRGGNTTANANRVRRVKIAFDVANVPAEIQGVHPVYLVITDANGVPIQRSDYIPVTIRSNNQDQQIMPAMTREENFSANQRFSYTHDLENKLDAGLYRLSVYTDLGLLGSTSFRMK